MKIILLTYQLIKRFFIFISLLLLLSKVSLFSQFSIENEIDSLRLEQKYKILLNPADDVINPLNIVMMKSEFYPAFESYYMNYPTTKLNLLSSFNMNRIKNDINRSLLVFREGQNRYHLGTISDILGYVNVAAAAGLAAYHIYKYRKKYGIK